MHEATDCMYALLCFAAGLMQNRMLKLAAVLGDQTPLLVCAQARHSLQYPNTSIPTIRIPTQAYLQLGSKP